MAELENQGLIAAPHRSAGRVPTAAGLRYFVDHLISPTEPQESCRVNAEQSLHAGKTTSALVKSASELLSRLTHWAGVVTVPKRDKLILKYIEFLPLGGNQVLAVLVVNERDVQNRIIFTHKTHSLSELQQAAQFLNQHFVGHDLLSARTELLATLEADKQKVDRILKTAVDMAAQAFQPIEPEEETVVVSGEHNVLNQVKAGGLEELHRWIQAFSEKQPILHLLNECILANGVQIFIGQDSGYDSLAHCSLITAHYQVDGQPAGVLGVIGPTRMQYNQVIPVVDMTAKLLSAALKTEQMTP
jgi:heat-inducible transcriptional repressor